MANSNGSTRMWIAILVAVAALFFGGISSGLVMRLNNRVDANTESVRKIDVILEKIDNIEKYVAEIKVDFKEHVKE